MSVFGEDIDAPVPVYGGSILVEGRTVYGLATEVLVAAILTGQTQAPVDFTPGALDPCLSEPCLSCPGNGNTGPGLGDCICDCAFLPSLETLLEIVEKFKAAVSRFYSSDIALSPLVTRYTAQATMNDYTRARFLWIQSHPNTNFDVTNMTHRFALRDIYLAYRLSGMELDPVVNTLG